MNGDFTRVTFDRARHFSRVLAQQGRVMLDADHNEQTDILLHYLRTLARDLIGPYAAPVENAGFSLSPSDKKNPDGGFMISAGRCYVDGILVENESDCPYASQPYYRLGSDDKIVSESKQGSGQQYWAYLDVWERHITFLEDDSIREKALGGPDTCTRSQVVWHVKVLPIDLDNTSDPKIAELEAGRDQITQQLAKTTEDGKKLELQNQLDEKEKQIAELRKDTRSRCDAPLVDLVTLSKAKLAARIDPGLKIEDPCITSPDSKYRGVENHLYRVEIHRGGKAKEATFKWSRDNGSNATAWLGTIDHGTSGIDIEVANTRGFSGGGWLELTNDSLDLAGEPGVLVKIAKVEGGRLSVDLGTVPKTGTPLAWNAQGNPKVRHWNHAQRGDIKLKEDGAVALTETSPTAEGWIDLEDGIQVRFEAGGEYRTGDYWLIPARVAIGKLEWPTTLKAGKEAPELLPPKGIQHHYAPLGFIGWRKDAANKQQWVFDSCRCDFNPLSSCFSMGSVAVGEHLLTEVRFQPAPVAKPTKKRKRSPN
jgi:hypothetical protein